MAQKKSSPATAVVLIILIVVVIAFIAWYYTSMRQPGTRVSGTPPKYTEKGLRTVGPAKPGEVPGVPGGTATTPAPSTTPAGK